MSASAFAPTNLCVAREFFGAITQLGSRITDLIFLAYRDNERKLRQLATRASAAQQVGANMVGWASNNSVALADWTSAAPPGWNHWMVRRTARDAGLNAVCGYQWRCGWVSSVVERERGSVSAE
jgi:hypothetical protein